MSEGSGFRWLLYFGGAFFAYPHKPLLNVFQGSPYEVAYQHFRRDHTTDANLVYHGLCLIGQLTGNFGLLGELDEKLGLKNVLSLATASTWAGMLVLNSSAPPAVKAMSVASLVLAYKLRHKIRGHWQSIMYLQAFIEMLAVQLFVVNDVRSTDGSKEVKLGGTQLLGMIAIRLLLQNRLIKSFQGELKGHKNIVNAVIFAFVGYACLDPFGKVPPFFLGLIGWALSLLTNQPWVEFYSLGFLATLGQGLSHHLAKEQGTMPQLAKYPDELAHATYFPNLLFQAIYHQLGF